MWGRTVGLLLDRGDVLLVDLEVHGDTGRLDGDTTLLFVFSCVRKPHVSSLRARNDTSLGDEGVGKSGLSVIDWMYAYKKVLFRVCSYMRIQMKDG